MASHPLPSLRRTFLPSLYSLASSHAKESTVAALTSRWANNGSRSTNGGGCRMIVSSISVACYRSYFLFWALSTCCVLPPLYKRSHHYHCQTQEHNKVPRLPLLPAPVQGCVKAIVELRSRNTLIRPKEPYSYAHDTFNTSKHSILKYNENRVPKIWFNAETRDT